MSASVSCSVNATEAKCVGMTLRHLKPPLQVQLQEHLGTFVLLAAAAPKRNYLKVRKRLKWSLCVDECPTSAH